MSSDTLGTNILFRFVRFTKSGKTCEFYVMTKDEQALLGRIAWFGRWRCYSFYPHPDTTFENTCLREIASFCEAQTAASRAKR